MGFENQKSIGEDSQLEEIDDLAQLCCGVLLTIEVMCRERKGRQKVRM